MMRWKIISCFPSLRSRRNKTTRITTANVEDDPNCYNMGTSDKDKEDKEDEELLEPTKTQNGMEESL